MRRLLWGLLVIGIALAAIIPTFAQDTYTVAPGDTLYRISARFKVPMATIAQANNIANPQRIYVGQQLVIPNGNVQPQPTQVLVSPNQINSATRDASAATTVLSYTVQRGDTLGSIARRYRTTIAALAQANGITNINQIRTGQVLKIVVVSGNTPLATPPPPSSGQTQPDIVEFSVEAASADRTALYTQKLQFPVSWRVANRATDMNLIFEQVLENGTRINIELPRSNPFVASNGRGIIAPVFPIDNANAQNITVRLSVKSLSNGSYITFRTVTIPLTGNVPPQMASVCRATLNAQTTLYSGPSTGYSYVSDVQAGEPFVVQARGGSNWYQLLIPVYSDIPPTGWVDGSRVTLSGSCDGLETISFENPVIQTFTAGITSLDWSALGSERARIPVSWSVTNRPPRTNLVFEQVQRDGNGINIELPRTVPIVPSSGNGVVQAIYPADDPNVTSITIRLRLINIDDGATITSKTVQIALTGSTPTPTNLEGFQEVISADQCYGADGITASHGVAVGKTGKGSTDLPPEGIEIVNAPRNGASIGRLNALDKFMVVEGPSCWRWTYASTSAQLVFRMWKVNVPAINVEGWVSEFWYVNTVQRVNLTMD